MIANDPTIHIRLLHAFALLIPGLAAGWLLDRLAAGFSHSGVSPSAARAPEKANGFHTMKIRRRRIAAVVITALLWAIEGWRLAAFPYGPGENIGLAAAELLFISAMVATALIDLESMIIPDSISLGGTVAGVTLSFLFPALQPSPTFAVYSPHLTGLIESVLGVAAWGLVGLFLYRAGKRLFRAKLEQIKEKDSGIDSALGWGDVKLMGCLGAFLGWRPLFHLLLIAALLGSAVGIYWKIRSGEPGTVAGVAALRARWNSGDSHFPFGPFLAAAAIIILFLR